MAALALSTVGTLLAGCSEADGPRTTGTPSAQVTNDGTPKNTTPISEQNEVATDLAVPWGIGFLPDDTAVVVERDSGQIVLLPPAQSGVERTAHRIGQVEVTAGSETGLLGVAVSPQFTTDRLLFLYLTTAADNRVVRTELLGSGKDSWRLGPLVPILTGIPTAEYHSGGRLAFSPIDGHLYVSTGDARQPLLAQDRDSLAGKILRITTAGQPAPGNPFGTPVWSLGHRNVQGLAFDAEGQLWASEFGDSRWDELNRIVPGGNYGWPYREGLVAGTHLPPANQKFLDPQAVWSTEEASPSGLAFWQGSLWMAALRGERIWEIPLTADGQVGDPREHLVEDLGRLRTVVVTTRNKLWVSTSNTDSRAEPRPGDDRIVQWR